MAHGFTETDGAVFTGQGAWHGLGIVVENAPTPAEALRLAGMDWQVGQLPLITTAADADFDGMKVESHVANVRSDTREILGVVGSGWKPVQNDELAEFATLLAKDNDVVRVESAASIHGGRRVWFLLRGQSFSVKGWNDEIKPYLLLCNGHDGSLAFRATPTSVRVVCNNTLEMALGKKSDLEIKIRHEGDMKAKLDETRKALKLYGEQREEFIGTVNLMADRKMAREDVQQFFLNVYQRAYEPIPKEPKTPEGHRQRERAESTIGEWCGKYDEERKAVGDTAWASLNAVTGVIQHSKVRGADDAAREANGINSKLFGTIADRTRIAAKEVLALL